MRNHEGRPAIQRTLLALGRIADECDRRAGPAPDDLLRRIGAEGRAAAQALASTDQRKQELIVEAQQADVALEEAYIAGVNRLFRSKAALLGLYGRAPIELAAFGVRTRKERAVPGPRPKRGRQEGPAVGQVSGR